ncbi:hypothetical protein O4H49_11290 [Kiloniella laminariae]|uniref:Uncharacterized protein n=1 Tax=Kiloniella laminariae TaxID=454162 RepID=A0ABT4LJS8_9PROT|nr:hypothetical protein [Kiloniella laminariae]MCZ4281365.1 hypothetical protein [Kiloniella laminariae]
MKSDRIFLEKLLFILAMSLVVFGLIRLFSPVGEPLQNQGVSVVGASSLAVARGPELPAYDIILFNDAGQEGGLLDRSLSGLQQEALRLGLHQNGIETACDLQGKRPDKVLWGQLAGLEHPDSLSVYVAEKLIYLGNYLEAWKIQAQGGTVNCYVLDEATTRLLAEL